MLYFKSVYAHLAPKSIVYSKDLLTFQTVEPPIGVIPGKRARRCVSGYEVHVHPRYGMMNVGYFLSVRRVYEYTSSKAKFNCFGNMFSHILMGHSCMLVHWVKLLLI